MVNKLAHLVIEGITYDIQDEELTSKFDRMTIELSLSNDYVITATLKDGDNTTLSTATIDLPSENSIVSLGYDTTTNEIIGIYRDDTVAVPHRIRVALSNLQEKLTAGQNISITNNTVSLLGLGEASTETVTGIATLDSSGKVPSSQLPSYVDDVLEYSTLQDFPVTGEAGKIYVTLDTNKTYRWTGSTYVEISQGVVLGETEYTAYRGDRGKIAYDHATAKGSAFQSGLYKITTNSEGHVTNATAVQKSDITSLGIPAQDTTYNSGVATEIDNNNNVNVKYDSDTLEVDSQNRLKVKSPSQTYNFNEAIENVNGTVNVRYKGGNWNIGRDSQTNQLTINGKFVKQVEDLDAYNDAPDGEIVEYIGETDKNYTNGYFYKWDKINGGSTPTPEYETVTIPSGKKIVTFTNRIDGSVIGAYELDNLQLTSYFNVPVNYTGTLYLFDKSNVNRIISSDNEWRNYIVPSLTPVTMYELCHLYEYITYYETLWANSGISQSSSYELFKSLISNRKIFGFKTNENSKCKQGIITDFYVQIRIPVIMYGEYVTTKDILTLNSDFENYYNSSPNAVANEFVSEHSSTYEINGDAYISNYKYYILTIDGISYYFDSIGKGSGSQVRNIYEICTEDGDVFYYVSGTTPLICLINKPTQLNNNTSFAELFYDIDKYLDWQASESETTESITIQKKVQTYNDYGLPILPEYGWQRIDVQPIGVQSYNDLSNKPLSVVNGEVKYTLSDGTTQLTLAQKSELATVATSGSYNDLTDTPTIPTSYNDLTDKPVIPTITFRQWNTTE